MHSASRILEGLHEHCEASHDLDLGDFGLLWGAQGDDSRGLRVRLILDQRGCLLQQASLEQNLHDLVEHWLQTCVRKGTWF